jgi:hypothetical protein
VARGPPCEDTDTERCAEGDWDGDTSGDDAAAASALRLADAGTAVGVELAAAVVEVVAEVVAGMETDVEAEALAAAEAEGVTSPDVLGVAVAVTSATADSLNKCSVHTPRPRPVRDVPTTGKGRDPAAPS